MTRQSPRPLTAILESALYASDLPSAEEFYRRVFGLEVIGRAEGRHVFLRCGSGVLLIFDPDATSAANGGVPPHGARGPAHLAFEIGAGEDDIAAWRERLRQEGIPVEAEVEWPHGGRSLYLRDPAGNSIELAPRAIWGIPEAS